MRMPIFFCLEAKVTSMIYTCKQLPKLKNPPERKADLRQSGIHPNESCIGYPNYKCKRNKAC